MVFCLHTVVSDFVLVCVYEREFLFYLFSFFFFKREQERRSWGSGNNLGGVGREYVQKIYCMEKFIFNKREKWFVIKTIKQC